MNMTKPNEYQEIGKWFVGVCHQCRDENKLIYAESEDDFSIIKGKPYHTSCAKLAGILVVLLSLGGLIK